MWFTQTTKGNIARITNDGIIGESKTVKGSEPFGITVDDEGDPWFTMMSAKQDRGVPVAPDVSPSATARQVRFRG